MFLREHGEALRADFRRVYGLSLTHCLAGRAGLGMQEVAGLAAQLPPGSMVWREFGGPMAWSDEVAYLVHVKHGLNILAWQHANQGRRSPSKQPEMDRPPELSGQQRAADAKAESKAERFLRNKRRGESG